MALPSLCCGSKYAAQPNGSATLEVEAHGTNPEDLSAWECRGPWEEHPMVWASLWVDRLAVEGEPGKAVCEHRNLKGACNPEASYLVAGRFVASSVFFL